MRSNARACDKTSASTGCHRSRRLLRRGLNNFSLWKIEGELISPQFEDQNQLGSIDKTHLLDRYGLSCGKGGRSRDELLGKVARPRRLRGRIVPAIRADSNATAGAWNHG